MPFADPPRPGGVPLITPMFQAQQDSEEFLTSLLHNLCPSASKNAWRLDYDIESTCRECKSTRANPCSDAIVKLSVKPADDVINIYDALTEAFATQHNPEHYCTHEGCNRVGTVLMKRRITCTPEFLVLQIPRYGGVDGVRISALVIFPPLLDLRRAMPEAVAIDSRLLTSYGLCAVVRHHGGGTGGTGGHYTALCCGPRGCYE